jgi:hypothetical protein
MMGAFAVGEKVEICPAQAAKGFSKWADLDGAEAKVLEVLGSGQRRKFLVQLTKGTRSGQKTLPMEILKPVEEGG